MYEEIITEFDAIQIDPPYYTDIFYDDDVQFLRRGPDRARRSSLKVGKFIPLAPLGRGFP